MRSLRVTLEVCRAGSYTKGKDLPEATQREKYNIAELVLIKRLPETIAILG